MFWANDRPVLLIPGFLAGDGSLRTMAHGLRANGYRTHRAGIRINVDCSAEACTRLEERLERVAHQTGQPVTIIGQSRGGTFARALAARRAQPVAGLVTPRAPPVAPPRDHPPVLLHRG